MMNELIEKYFEHTLTEEEKLLFNKLLFEDADFKKEFEFYSELKNAVAVSERQKIKKEIQQFEEVTKKPIFTLQHYFKFAAILLIMLSIGIYFYSNQNNAEKLYVAYYEAYPNTVISNTRSNSAEKSDTNDAFIAYDLNDFEKASKLFDRVLKNSVSDEIVFYKAVCLMELNQHKKALDLFESIPFSENYEAKALWFKALCYLKLDDKSKAKITLKKLLEINSFKKTEAQDLLSKLKE